MVSSPQNQAFLFTNDINKSQKRISEQDIEMTKTKRKDNPDPDWWLTAELLPPDPWAYIVSDFQWSWEILAEASNWVTASENKSVGHYPDSSSPYERIKDALNITEELQENIRGMISARQSDLNFAWQWGEYQKAIAIIYASLPHLEKNEAMHTSAQIRSEEKEKARCWYVLWYDWHQKSRAPKRISREVFDKYFVRILKEIKEGRRAIPDSVDSLEMHLLLIRFFDGDDQEGLTNFFTRKFYGDDVEKTRRAALQIAPSLPPVGEEYYPPVKN